jgi:BlaI family transcriptional regulator, penicillinase repressor
MRGVEEVSVSLSNREAEIMAVLWEQGPSTVTEVKDKLSDELAYTTVLTILRNLEAKGYVGHAAEGRAHRYVARIRRQAARKSAIRHLAGKLFQGSADLLLTQLVSDRKLSEDQVRRIRKILEEKPGKEKS